MHWFCLEKMWVPASDFLGVCVAEGARPVANRSHVEQGSRAARNPAASEQAMSALIMAETRQNKAEARKLWQHLT